MAPTPTPTPMPQVGKLPLQIRRSMAQKSLPYGPIYYKHPVISVSVAPTTAHVEVVMCTTHPQIKQRGRESYVVVGSPEYRIEDYDEDCGGTGMGKEKDRKSFAALYSRRTVPKEVLKAFKDGEGREWVLAKKGRRKLGKRVREFETKHGMGMCGIGGLGRAGGEKKKASGLCGEGKVYDGPACRTRSKLDLRNKSHVAIERPIATTTTSKKALKEAVKAKTAGADKAVSKSVKTEKKQAGQEIKEGHSSLEEASYELEAMCERLQANSFPSSPMGAAEPRGVKALTDRDVASQSSAESRQVTRSTGVAALEEPGEPQCAQSRSVRELEVVNVLVLLGPGPWLQHKTGATVQQMEGRRLRKRQGVRNHGLYACGAGCGESKSTELAYAGN